MRSNTQMDRNRGNCREPLAFRSRFFRHTGTALALSISAWTMSVALSPAMAGECNKDIGALMQKRQQSIEQLNKLAKASPKGQLDPIASCPKLRGLAVIEQELAAYLTKNKDWCMVPDNAVAGIQPSSKHTREIAGKACKVAEQIKKGQEAGAAAAPKLPAGPL